MSRSTSLNLAGALPHQAKGSNTEIRSSAHEQDVSTLTRTKKGYKSGNTNEDTATVATYSHHFSLLLTTSQPGGTLLFFSTPVLFPLFLFFSGRGRKKPTLGYPSSLWTLAREEAYLGCPSSQTVGRQEAHLGAPFFVLLTS